ncbi:MAG: NAD(P)-dependent oxidoreductase [Paracoccaceae bacterium]
MRVQISARPEVAAEYAAKLPDALAQAGVEATVGDAAPAEVDWVVYGPDGGLSDFAPYTRLRGILSLWAGVEDIVDNPTITVPIHRMVDPGLTARMVRWVAGHVLHHHLGTPAHEARGTWRAVAPPDPGPVTILGAGALGVACGAALRDLGFPVTLWSRGPKDLDGMRSAHGAAGLEEALRGAWAVVGLLPDTPATRGLMDAERLGWMRDGALLMNAGRGTLIDEGALLARLDAGLGHAVLDALEPEPLPDAHPFWAHPRVTVTPHVAAVTPVTSACRSMAAVIARDLAGGTPLHTVDRAAGY